MSTFLDPKLSALEPYVPGEQPRGIDRLLKLNTNENPYPPAPGVIKVLEELDPASLALYPDPEARDFKSALAKAFGRPEECFTVGNGSDEILAFCFLGLCGKGAAFPDITYSFYPVLAQLMGVVATVVPLDEGFRWSPADYQGMKQTLFIANPNAPTGIAAPLEDIQALLEQDPDRLVVVDEAYVDFGAQTALPLLDDYSNLLVVRTLSKSRSLAGQRAAFAVGSPDLIADMEGMRFSLNPYNLDRIALQVAAAAVEDHAYFQETRQAIMEVRDRTTAQLEPLGFRILPSSANFIFAAPPCSAREYVAALREEGIIVRYFDAPRISDWVRISIGKAEDMERFVETTALIVRG